MTTAMKTKLREVKTRFRHLQSFTEASIDKQARTARVVIITEGLGNLRDKNFYTKNAVASCVKAFNGRQFFIDHPSESEEHDRPERSVRDLAGYFYDTKEGTVRDPDTGEQLVACFASLRFDESTSGQLALDKVASAIEYQKRFPDSKDVYAGISINGGGVGHPGTIKGMQVNMVTEIQEAFSADIVTKPARGGKFLALMQEAAKVRRWKQKTARESRTLTLKGSEGGAMSKVKESKPKQKAAVKEARKALRVAVAGFKESVAAKKPKTALRTLYEALKTCKERGMRANEDEVKALMRKMRAAINDGGDPMTIVKDIQADVAQLGKSIAPPKQDEDEKMAMRAGEDEDEAKTDEAEDEDEAKTDESEDEEESEARTDESEDEEESEGEEESEDEEEGEMGYADEDEDEDEDGSLGMDDEPDDDEDMDEEPEDEDEAGQAMQYKCAKCGEVNQVMPPKGYSLAKMGESAKKGKETADEKALRETIAAQRRKLDDKEKRFSESNKKTRKLIEENVRLRAEVLGHRRMKEARKLLKEAKIPTDVLSVSELVQIEDKAVWPIEIKRAQRALSRESAMFQDGARPHVNGGGSKKVDEATDASATFKRFYESDKKDDGDDE